MSPAPLESSPPAVEFRGISKAFFGVPVLREVSFAVSSGRICGVVGENGAGKSTLMNILGGVHRPDRGELSLAGKTFDPRDPSQSRDAGIGFVHQELNLFPNLSIAENLHLTGFPRLGETSGRTGSGFPWIDRAAVRKRSRYLLNQVGLDLDPDTPLERLPAGERQLVEIARALGVNARILIFDEPTTSLSAPECHRLFALMRELRDRGLALLLISHALGDVLRLCDDIVVLRDGEVVAKGEVGTFDTPRLVAWMVGRDLRVLHPVRARWTENAAMAASAGLDSPPALQVIGLTQPGVIRDIHFQLAAGEVLGLSGLMGAGRSELARILFGLDPAAEGRVLLRGRELQGPPRRRIARGLAFLTEDRRADGLCVDASIADNLVLASLRRHARTPARLLSVASLRAAVGRIREAVRLTPSARNEQPVRTLSGGNQQKVVLGKWLLAEPEVLILDEPTRGIDVGARFEIYQWIHQLADQGAGILVISSDIEELLAICDRLLVMRQGALVAEFPRSAFDRERILAAALHDSRSG